MKGTPQMIQIRRVYRLAGVMAVCVMLSLCAPAARGGVFANVPEAAGYSLVYDLPIPTTGATFNSTGVPYSVNNAAAIADGSFTRVGYYLELAANVGDPVQYVYASFDAAGFSTQASKLGVPAASTGAVYQQKVTNMNVVSNVPGIVTGTGLTTGNVEFWPTNYSQATGLAGIGGDGSKFDYNDTRSATGNHACMQIHNHGTGTDLPQTLFGFSDWGGNNPTHDVELGIGTNTGAGDPDWTFSNTGANWAVKTLQVVVGGTPMPAPEAPAHLIANAPELAGYKLVYQKALPDAANLNANGTAYDLDYSTGQNVAKGTFSRVAYYVELHKTGDAPGATTFVEVSADAVSISTDPAKIGIPTTSATAAFQKRVTNMNVTSNAGITTGTGLETGNIEFWPSNYGTGNDKNIPNAAGDVYDHGDGGASMGAGYGSMQIHNHDTGGGQGETVFAYSAWGNNNADNLGIGNNTGAHPDYTFEGNAGTYDVKNLYVLVGGAPVGPAIKIMPVGDSITYGSSVVGGYRAPLEHLLAEEGLNTEFVGAASGNSFGMTSIQHEGYSGYKVLGIQNLPIATRISTYQPDVVLLMIGTNDMSAANADAADQLDTLIGTIESVILDNGEQTKLIVAQIVPRNEEQGQSNTSTLAYNVEVARIVGKYQDLGYPVSLVDMYNALDPTYADLADAVHPSLAGYDKMAATWLPAITQAVPEPATMALLSLGALGLRRRKRA